MKQAARLYKILISACMVLVLLPTMVLANTVDITTEADLINALGEITDATINITADITLNEATTVGANHTIHIANSNTLTIGSINPGQTTLTIPANKTLTISGEGTFEVGSAVSIGVIVEGTMVVDGGNLTVKNELGYSIGVWALGSLMIEDSTLSIENKGIGSTGIYGNITITNSDAVISNITSSGQNQGISVSNLVIDNSTVTLRNSGNYPGTSAGIISYGGSITIQNDSVVTIETTHTGISFNSNNPANFIIDSSTLEIQSGFGIRLGFPDDINFSGANSGSIELTAGSKIYDVQGKMKDQGYILTKSDVTVEAEDATPSENGLTAGTYVWEGTHFTKGATPAPTYTATLNIFKNDTLYADSTPYTLKLSGNETTTVNMTGSATSTRTAAVPNGTWKVYDLNGYTGIDIIINDAPGNAQLDIYSGSYSVNPQGTATGGSLSAVITAVTGSQFPIAHPAPSVIYYKGDSVTFTAIGTGASEYTYEWSGTNGLDTISGTGSTYTISSVTSMINIICTIKGSSGSNGGFGGGAPRKPAAPSVPTAQQIRNDLASITNTSSMSDAEARTTLNRLINQIQLLSLSDRSTLATSEVANLEQLLQRVYGSALSINAATTDSNPPLPIVQTIGLGMVALDTLTSGNQTNITLNLTRSSLTATQQEAILSLIDKTINPQLLVLDLSITQESNGVATSVTSTSLPITITLMLPKGYDPNGVYQIARIHDGKTELLPVTNHGNGTISFSTSLFSTYVLVHANQAANLSYYSNSLFPIYENSRIVFASQQDDSLILKGYALEQFNHYAKKNAFVRELIFLDKNDPSNPNNAYRIPLTAVYDSFLNNNKTLNPDGKYDYSYAYYGSILNLNKVRKYTSPATSALVSLPQGEYLVYIRLSDGKRSNLLSLKNTKSDVVLPASFTAMETGNIVFTR